ncbi:MAG: pirin family protein [Planctomycetota bacterium]|jgi:redox-sensitive bicupin YhaK (pirin superfamily)
MITIRRAADRGHADHGWLLAKHTFSFADYRDPRHTRFRTLRVLNEDVVQPGRGFGTHPHADMEILTWVLSGALEHEDSMGNGSTIRPGEAQRMSAGTGVTHSEFNPSGSEPVHLLQIWIFPRQKGLPPGYEQRAFPEETRRGRLALIASPDGADGSVTLQQDARVHAGLLAPGDTVTHELLPGRGAWVHVARGAIDLDGERLAAGDGAAVEDVQAITLAGVEDAEVLVFDLA